MSRAAYRLLLGRSGLLACLLASSGFGWPGRAQRLVTELHGDGDASTRSDLVRLLGQLDEPEAQAGLIEACSDRQAEVRAAALLGLSHSAKPPLEIIRPLLTDLAPGVRAAAATALGRAGDEESVERLVRTLADEEPGVRVASARALGMMMRARASTALASALSDPSREVAMAAGEALCTLGGHEAASLLAGRFAGLSADVQRVVLEALSTASADLARRPAALALVSEDPSLVRAGLRLVLRHQLREQLPALEALRTANDPGVASAAQLALTGLGRAPAVEGPPDPWLPALMQSGNPALPADQVERTLQQLERLVPDGQALAGDPLAEWLPRAPPRFAARIARLLARTHAPVNSAPLLPLVQRRDAPLRAALCDVFAQTGQPQLAAQLMPLWLDDNPQVRVAAAGAVGAVVDAKLARALVARLDHLRALTSRERPRLAQAVARASQRLANAWDSGERKWVRRALLEALDSADEPTAAYLLRALSAVDPAAASELLQTQGPRLRVVRRVALLRASALDHGPSAQALRAMYRKAREPALWATALTAQIVAGDPEPSGQSLAMLTGHAWPLGPIAAFGLSRSPPAELSPQRDALCSTLRKAREPLTARNLRVTITRIDADCGVPEAADDAPATDHVRAIPDMKGTATFRALLLPDQSVLVSVPDASGDASWPTIQAVGERSAWHLPYRSNR